MQSPIDRQATLTRFDLLPGLEGWRCPSSNGIWIDGEAYWKWLLSQPNFPEVGHSVQSDPVRVVDTDHVLISPRSGRIMSKFRVGRDLGFQIDFDRATGGFWLDKDEYKALRSREMHDELHLICDNDYQKKLRELERTEAKLSRIAALVGKEEKDRLEKFAQWVSTHPNKDLILAYFLELASNQ